MPLPQLVLAPHFFLLQKLLKYFVVVEESSFEVVVELVPGDGFVDLSAHVLQNFGVRHHIRLILGPRLILEDVEHSAVLRALFDGSGLRVVAPRVFYRGDAKPLLFLQHFLYLLIIELSLFVIVLS